MASEPPTVAESLSVGENSTEDPQSPRLSAIVMAETMSLLESDDEGGKPKKSSSSKKSKSGRGEAVSVERKEELLLEARVNRLQWVHQVPLPYRKAESPDDPWVQQKSLANFLKTCHAAALMPSMTKVLSHLYGMEDHRVPAEDVALRIENLVSSF